MKVKFLGMDIGHTKETDYCNCTFENVTEYNTADLVFTEVCEIDLHTDPVCIEFFHTIDYEYFDRYTFDKIEIIND